MTLHFIHIGKTGGTAIKRALRRGNYAYWPKEHGHDVHATPYGRIQLHPHAFSMASVPAGDHAFFCVRDPVDRFVSAFYSRLNKGRPRYHFEWNDTERRIFETFTTPQQLALALLSDDPAERTLARSAMRRIRHLRPMSDVVSTRQLWRRLGRVVYIARQETLDTDWEQLTSLLGITDGGLLPQDPRAAHRRDRSLESPLDDAAVAVLREWYRDDYTLLKYCDAIRALHGWGTGRAAGRRRLRHGLALARGLPAFLPAEPPLRRRRRSARR